MKTRGKEEKAPYDKSLRPAPKPWQFGDWAGIAVLSLAIGLWFLWPGTPPTPAASQSDREFTCRYGVLSPNSTAGDVLARFSGRTDEISSAMGPFARIPTIPAPPIPAAAPAQAAETAPPPYPAEARNFPKIEFSPPPPPFPYTLHVAGATGIVVKVSDSLRNAGFSFAPPHSANMISFALSANQELAPDPEGDAPFALSATLAFNADGMVETLLIDGFTGPDDILRDWRTALQFARSSKATGTIEVTRQRDGGSTASKEGN